LIPTWTVHDVAAHLVVPIEASLARVLLTALTSGSLDRFADRLTWRMARQPASELAEVLRTQAENRFAPPFLGPIAPMTDLLVHGLDLRLPLGIPRAIPEERTRLALDFLTGGKAFGFVRKGWLNGLRFEATNMAWTHGQGPLLRGHSDALMLAMTGRALALDPLEGDGVPMLRCRFG
jgi:uncharacterized protein (TIGR03083 family)